MAGEFDPSGHIEGVGDEEFEAELVIGTADQQAKDSLAKVLDIEAGLAAILRKPQGDE